MRYSHPVTPVELSPALIAICEQLAPGTKPIYIDVLSDTGAPTNECFHLVEERARREGGSRLIGWALWEMPGLYAEAEYHAIWQAPDGRYLDISPKLEPTAKVLFLPIPGAEYNDLQKDNVRRAISKDPYVQLFLQCFERRFEIMNRGDRAGQYGEISLGFIRVFCG